MFCRRNKAAEGSYPAGLRQSGMSFGIYRLLGLSKKNNLAAVAKRKLCTLKPIQAQKRVKINVFAHLVRLQRPELDGVLEAERSSDRH